VYRKLVGHQELAALLRGRFAPVAPGASGVGRCASMRGKRGCDGPQNGLKSKVGAIPNVKQEAQVFFEKSALDAYIASNRARGKGPVTSLQLRGGADRASLVGPGKDASNGGGGARECHSGPPPMQTNEPKSCEITNREVEGSDLGGNTLEDPALQMVGETGRPVLDVALYKRGLSLLHTRGCFDGGSSRSRSTSWRAAAAAASA